MSSKVNGGGVFEWVRRHPLLLLLAIFLFHTANTFIVVSLDRQPFFTDEALHFKSCWPYCRGIGHMGLNAGISPSAHPPLMQLLSIPWYWALGYRQDVAIYSGLLAALVLVLSVYGIGKALHSMETGLLAATLTILLPGVVGFSRVYLQEFTLMATVALSLALMLRSQGFSHKGYTLAFGLSVGVGLLAKWSYTAFVIGPFMLYAWRSYRRMSGQRGVSLWACWLLLSVGAGLYLASGWYLPNMQATIELIGSARSTWSDGTPLLSGKNALYYPSAVFTVQLLPFFTVAAVVFLFYLLRLKENALTFLLLWIVLPYLILSFLVVAPMNPRFILAYLPAFAILIAAGVRSVPRTLGRWVMAVVVLGGLLQFLLLTYLMPPVPPGGRMNNGMLAPDRTDWGLTALRDSLGGRIASNAHVVSLNDDFYNALFFRSEANLDALPPLEVTDLHPCFVGFAPCAYDLDGYEQLLIGADAVIIGKYRGSLPMRASRAYEDAQEAWSQAHRLYRLVGQSTLPDDSLLQIYVKRNLNSISSEPRHDSGADRQFDFRVGQGSEPLVLLIDYLAPGAAVGERIPVRVQGIPLANLSRTPPLPDVTIGVLLPQGMPHDGMVSVSMAGSAPISVLKMSLLAAGNPEAG